MSDTTPESPVEPTPVEPALIDPVATEAAAPREEALASPTEPVITEPATIDAAEKADATESAEPIDLVEPTPDSSIAEPVVVDTVTDGELTEVPVVTDTTIAGDATAVPVTAVPVTSPQTVYVHAPVPPQKKGNRGVGSLIALLSAAIFAALYAGLVLIVVPWFAPPRAVSYEFLNFVTSWAFFVPVLVFAAALILLVLILNRAGWWAYILGSLFVGLVVYFVSIGILLLGGGIIGLTPSQGLTAFLKALQSPEIIIAGLVAREVSLWMGAAIAARGRKVKVRNAETRAAYDRDTARARADYERAVAANAAQ